MSSFELNKIFAAILCAGITVMLGGFLGNILIPSHTLEQDAVAIEGAAEIGGGAVDAGPQLPDPIMALLAAADLEKGAKLSKACAACHSFDQGGPTKQGPNLWGVVGSQKASKAGFAYSDALSSFRGAWNYDALNQFIAKPKKYVSGTKMNFVGLKKPEDRAAIIAWLREKSSSPLALPSDADIAAEQAAFAPKTDEGADDGEESTEAQDAETEPEADNTGVETDTAQSDEQPDNVDADASDETVKDEAQTTPATAPEADKTDENVKKTSPEDMPEDTATDE